MAFCQPQACVDSHQLNDRSISSALPFKPWPSNAILCRLLLVVDEALAVARLLEAAATRWPLMQVDYQTVHG